MARRKPIHIEGQADLFVGGSVKGEYGGSPVRTWQEIETNPALGSPFILNQNTLAVDVASRAHYLRSAAINQGKANQRRGFADAVEIEPHASEIWGR